MVDFDMESLSIDAKGYIRSRAFLEEIDASYVGLLKFPGAGLKKILEIWDRDYIAYQERGWKQSGKNIRKVYMADLL